LSKTSERATLAARTRWHQGDGPEAQQARRNLAALGLEEHVLKVLAAAPRPSDEQLQRIVAILMCGDRQPPGTDNRLQRVESNTQQRTGDRPLRD
jgi:hypothetical protein